MCRESEILMSEKNDQLSYQKNILYQTDDFEVVSIEWTKDSNSELHNHGWSQCSVLIEDGIFENILTLGLKKEIQTLEKGQVITTPIGSHHELRCLSSKGRTLHVYIPKISVHNENGIFQPTHSDQENLIQNEIKLSAPINIQSLKTLLARVKDFSISTHSPYFMNQLFSGVTPQMILAEEIITHTKTTLATNEASPIFSHVESEVVESLGEIIGWQSGSRDGVCVPGGSAANFMAIHCARQKKFPNLRKTGAAGQIFKIFISTEAHYSFKKACVALGIGTDNLILIPADKFGCMQTKILDQKINEAKAKQEVPLLVCATAGTTVLGAFDPIEEISVICKKHSIWLHVDGAWGGPVMFSSQSKKLVSGIEYADSVTFDAHKLFGASLTSSFFLTRHADLLLQANDVSGGDYLFHSDNPNLDRGKLSWQCGRKADAFSFWTIWKSLGTKGLGDFVDRLAKIRDDILPWIESQSRLELVARPEFLNICIRVKPPNFKVNAENWSKVVRESLKEKNLAMVNYSSDDKGYFLRLILAHPNLQINHVKQILTWALEVE